MVRQKVDSLKKVLANAKGDAKIDCLNVLAADYFWLDDGLDELYDTGYIFAKQAYNETKTSNYKRGVGYACLQMGSSFSQRVDDDRTNNKTETNYIEAVKYLKQAIEIGEEINDYNMLGDVYNVLLWMEKWKGGTDKYKNNLEKAIYYYEKSKKIQKDIYNEITFASCPECNGNEKILGFLYGELAVITKVEKNKSAAEELINKAIHYHEMTGSKSDLGNFYSSLTQSYFLSHEYKSSIEAAIKSISYYKDVNDVESEIRAMTKMCAVYEITGDFESGIDYGKRSIKLAEELKNSSNNLRGRSSGQSFFWMCRLYIIAGDYETALDVLRRGRNYYPDPIDSVSKAFWSSLIGNVHRLMGNYDSALYYLKLFEKTENDPNNFGKISLGYLYIDLKEYNKALAVVLPFSLYLRKINIIMPPIADCMIIAGNASLNEKKYNQALQYARDANSYLKMMDGRTLMIPNYKLLSDIFEKLHIYDSAYYYMNQYTSLKDSLINRQFYWKLSNYKKEAEEVRKTSQINLLNKTNQLKEQKLKKQAFVKNSLIVGLLLLFLLGVFIFRNLSLKRKNDKLRLQKDLELQQLESEKKQAELHQKAIELEMQALRAQMNPHFIFNCLSSINRFIFKNDNKTASDYLTRFSRLIRMVLMHSSKKLITLEDELEMLRLYLDLERLRFKDAFDYSITTTNIVDVGAIFIPPLLLQPFCENAVWHGLMHKESKGHLNIIISEIINENEKVLHCVIEDDGVGREKSAEMKSKSAESEKSLGLKITTERLALLNQENNFSTFYKIEDILNENNEVAGTRVQLKIRHKESIEKII